jgi:hypothetical protein
LHCSSQPQAFVDRGFWQPHLQLEPGHWLQRQVFWFASFMMALLSVWGIGVILILGKL